MPTEQDNPNEIFDTIGLDFKKEGSELVTDCPFCGKHKFYLNEKRSVYDCKVCGASGNQHTILSAMAGGVYSKEVQAAHFGRLATYRGLPEHAFRLDSDLGYDTIHSRYVWAVRKPDGKVQGLRTWKDPGQGKKGAIHNLKGCKLGLLGAEQLADQNRKTETVYLTEGEWDRHGLLYLLDATANTGIALAVPGANNFGPDWPEWLQGRDVVVLYDNDEPGKTGTVKVSKKLNGRCSRIRYLHWDDKKKDGYDVHDLVRDNLNDPDVAWAYLNGRLKAEPTGKSMSSSTGVLAESDDRQKEQEAIELYDVPRLHATFHRWLTLDNCDLLDIVMGTFWSIYLPGSPLWMMVVAPPSGSKSESIMPASQWWRCHAISNMTSKSLMSGFQMNGGADPSLLASLEGKRAVIAIKDLTPLLQGAQEEQDEVFGILRDAYDGKISKTFGNGICRSYKALHFGMVAGVTPAIDGYGNTSMGERFLKFRADHDTHRHDDIGRAEKAISNCGGEDNLRKELQAACVGALQRPFLEENVVQPTPDFARYIARLAYCTARLRAAAPTEKGSDYQNMAPVVEAAPRLATQFTKLAQGLALHLEARSIMDATVLRLVRRVALHTPDKVTVTVIKRLRSNPGASVKDITNAGVDLGYETVNRTITRLIRTGAVVKSSKEGLNGAAHIVAPDLDSYIDDVRMFDDLPINDPYYTVAPKRVVMRRATR